MDQLGPFGVTPQLSRHQIDAMDDMSAHAADYLHDHVVHMPPVLAEPMVTPEAVARFRVNDGANLPPVDEPRRHGLSIYAVAGIGLAACFALMFILLPALVNNAPMA